MPSNAQTLQFSITQSQSKLKGSDYKIRLWIQKFEKLFIRHLWHNSKSNARWECSRLGRKHN